MAHTQQQNQQPRKKLTPKEWAEKQQKAADRKIVAAADPDGVSFVAVSREVKILAWNAEQMDPMVKKIRANTGGLGRIPAAKAEELMERIKKHAMEGHLLNEALHRVVKLVDRDYRYLAHTDLRKLQEQDEKVAARVAAPAKLAAVEKGQKAKAEKAPAPAPAAIESPATEADHAETGDLKVA